MATMMRLGWCLAAISPASCTTDVQAPSLMQVNTSKAQILDAALVDSENEESKKQNNTQETEHGSSYYDYDVYDILYAIDYYHSAGKGEGGMMAGWEEFQDDYAYAAKGKGKLSTLKEKLGYDYDVYDIFDAIDYYHSKGKGEGGMKAGWEQFQDDYAYAGKGKGKLSTLKRKLGHADNYYSLAQLDYYYDVYDIFDAIDDYHSKGKGEGGMKAGWEQFQDDYAYAAKGKGKLSTLKGKLGHADNYYSLAQLEPMNTTATHGGMSSPTTASTIARA